MTKIVTRQRNIWFLPFLLFISLTWVSCQVDDVNPSGSDDDRDKFIGTWSVNDTPARLNYEVTITKATNSAELTIANFADLGGSVTALVVGNNFFIDGQTVSGFLIEGSGSYESSSKLQSSYSMNDQSSIENRIAVFSR